MDAHLPVYTTALQTHQYAQVGRQPLRIWEQNDLLFSESFLSQILFNAFLQLKTYLLVMMFQKEDYAYVCLTCAVRQ